MRRKRNANTDTQKGGPRSPAIRSKETHYKCEFTKRRPSAARHSPEQTYQVDLDVLKGGHRQLCAAMKYVTDVEMLKVGVWLPAICKRKVTANLDLLKGGLRPANIRNKTNANPEYTERPAMCARLSYRFGHPETQISAARLTPQ